MLEYGLCVVTGFEPQQPVLAVLEERMTSEQLSHLAMIGFHIYGSVDLAVNCIIELRQRGRVADDAVEQLMQLFD